MAPSPLIDPSGDRPRPVFVTDDHMLLDDLLRLATAAGVEPFVVPTLEAAGERWQSASLVLVGVDAPLEPAVRHLTRRTGVVVVGRAGPDSPAAFEHAVALGAERVVILPDGEAWLVDELCDVEERVTPGSVVTVVGGRGGAGATTLACSLAVTALRRGLRTMLLDADPLGGGIDLVFGAESASGLRWPQLASARGRVSATALHDALPRIDELTVLTFDRGAGEPVAAEAMSAMLRAGTRGHDIVVADLPRRLDPGSTLLLQHAQTCLLVVPAEIRAAVAATRVARVAAAHCADLRLVVRGPAPGGLSAADIAESLAIPLCGELRPEPRLAGDLESGEPPARTGRGPLARFCRAFLDGLLAQRADRVAGSLGAYPGWAA